MGDLNKHLPNETIKWLRMYGYTLNNGDFMYYNFKNKLKNNYPYEYYFFVDSDVRKEALKSFEGVEHTKDFYKSWSKNFRHEKKRIIKEWYGLEKKWIR